MGGSKSEVARVREALSSLIDISGLSRREIARRLAQQGSGLDVSRLLGGQFELKLRQVLDILGVLEIHPLEFFRLIFKEPELRSPLLQRLQVLVAATRPPTGTRHPHPSDRDLDELRRRVDEISQLIEQLRAKPK